jgi:acyl carrier protein
MQDPRAAEIEQGVMWAIQTASRRPVEPTLESELVADLGFDSLQVLDVIAEIEGRFDIVVPLDAVPATRTVGQVVAEVTRLVRARGNG